jgi:hypothetical protein
MVGRLQGPKLDLGRAHFSSLSGSVYRFVYVWRGRPVWTAQCAAERIVVQFQWPLRGYTCDGYEQLNRQRDYWGGIARFRRFPPVLAPFATGTSGFGSGVGDTDA